MLFVRDFLADQQVFRRPEAPTAPAVSVVLPTFQRRAGGLLQRALDSVLSQSCEDLELIVVDDGSVDGTRELIQALQREDPRIVHVRHELNCGLPALRVNEGIELARGAWIAFQFDDDEWLAGGLQALVDGAAAAPEPSVVFGRAEWFADTWVKELPGERIDRTRLTDQNDIANNAVLVPRRLFETCGMYDPHVGMRRLCDWDLWLRLIMRAPFVPVDRRVSRVPYVSDPTAIGVTVPFDFPLARFQMSIPRDAALGLDRWRDYQVDGLRVAGIDVPGALGERLEREHLRPFRARLRHAFPHLRGDPLQAADSPRVLLCAADAYSVALDLCVAPYDALSCRRGGYKQVFHPVWQLGAEAREGAGMLLFVGTVSSTAAGLIAEAAAAGPPVAYYFDDLAAEHPARPELERQVAAVDAVWSTGPECSDAIRRLNPRIVPHRAAVPEHWLPRALEPRASSGRLRVGCLGFAGRGEDLRPVLRALRAVAERWGDRLELELWGVDAGELPPFASPVVRRPFTDSFGLFVARLRQGRFDVLLTPLPDSPESRLPRVLGRYLMTAVAGALGILSDVRPYARLLPGLTCLKADNTPAAWEAALEAALTLPVERFDAMRRALVEHVRLEHTAEAQIHLHEAACHATALHAATRRQRVGGRPPVLYLFAPGASPARDRELLLAAELARDYGLAPHALCAGDAGGLQARLVGGGIPFDTVARELLLPGDAPGVGAPLRAWLDALRPAIVHASAPLSAAAALCQQLGLPLVATPPGWRRASELFALYAAAAADPSPAPRRKS